MSSDYFGDDETLVQRVYAWSLGGCAGNQVCVNAEGAMTEEDVCTGGDVSVEPACHDTGESAPGAVGDCCSNDALSASYFADQCTGTDMLSCVNGKVEKKVCHGGCSVSEGLVTCQICRGTGVSSGGAPGDCCTDDYEETCHENGKLVCHNGVVVQERCLGSCIDDATEKYDLICLEPLKASEEDFKLYVRVMRDIDMSGIVAAKDTEVGCAGIWDSIDLYETHFDGNGKTITFTSGGRSCGMTTPLFDQVVSSQIEDLNLKYNMRGSASSALSNYLVMSGVSNVHYDGDISVGFSVLGESAGIGFGAMAKYSAYSVFDRISMKGSSVSYAGKYYGLLAHGEIVTIHQAEVLTEDLNCLSGYCAGSFGFITDSMLRDLTVNIPKVSYGTAEMTAGIMFLLNTRLEDYDFKLDSVTQDSTLGGSFAGAIFASEGVNIVDVKHEVTSMDIITGGSSFGSVGGSIKNVTSKAGTLKSENNSIYGLFDDSNGQIENVQFEADTVEAKNGYAYGFGGYLSASLKDVKSTIKTVKSENSVAMGFCSSLSGNSSQNITSQVTTVDGYYVYGFSSGVNGTVNNVQSTVGTVKADYSVYGFTSSLNARMTDVKNHITKIESSSMYGGVYGFANYHTGSINGLEHRVDEIIISKPNNSVAVYPVFYTVQFNYSSYGFSLKNANIDIGTVITGGYVYGLGYRHSCRNGAGDIVGLRYHADKLVSKNGIAYGMYYEVESLELSDAAIRIDHLQGGNGVSMIGYMNYHSAGYTNKFTDVAVYADMYAMNPSSAYGFIQLHKVYSGNSSYTSRFNRVAVSNRISSYTASQLNSDGIATSGTVLHNRSHVLYSVNYTGYNIVPTNMYWLRRDSSDFAYRSNDTSGNETKFTPYTTTNGMTITGSLNNAHGGTVWIPLLIEEESNEFYIPWLNNL